MIDPQRILDAQSLLARHFGPTRIARAASLSSPLRNVFLKIETGLPTGSFKVRGAIYALSMKLAGREGLQAAPRISEVVCASTGNHGAAVAYAAKQLGIRATIFLPARHNLVKAARVLDLGARLVEAGADISDAIDGAEAYAAREGAFFLHDARDPDVPAGAGTIGLEIVGQLPAVDVIYVPMGDTALIRGVASAVKQRRPSVRIVGVVAERAPAYLLSWQRVVQASGEGGRPADGADLKVRTTSAADVIETATCDTIADGLAIRRPLAANVHMVHELVDDVVAVSELEMMVAIEWLHAREQVIAEPAGAAATAAVLKQSTAAGTIVALVTGGNIAPDLRLKLMGGDEGGSSTTPASVA
jgi:threonine dehydratase